MRYVSKGSFTLYREDVELFSKGDPRFRYVSAGDFKGRIMKVPFAPGPRPRRKKGESPLS